MLESRKNKEGRNGGGAGNEGERGTISTSPLLYPLAIFPARTSLHHPNSLNA